MKRAAVSRADSTRANQSRQSAAPRSRTFSLCASSASATRRGSGATAAWLKYARLPPNGELAVEVRGGESRKASRLYRQAIARARASRSKYSRDLLQRDGPVRARSESVADVRDGPVAVDEVERLEREHVSVAPRE